jgi:hypothetical protein
MTALTSGNRLTETSLASQQMPETGETPLSKQAVPRGRGCSQLSRSVSTSAHSSTISFNPPGYRCLILKTFFNPILFPQSACTVCNQQQQNLCELTANDCLSKSLTPAVTKGGNLPLRRRKGGGKIFVSFCFRSQDSVAAGWAVRGSNPSISNKIPPKKPFRPALESIQSVPGFFGGGRAAGA